MVYTTEFKRTEETKIIYNEKIYSDTDFTQAQLRALVPSMNEDTEKEPS